MYIQLQSDPITFIKCSILKNCEKPNHKSKDSVILNLCLQLKSATPPGAGLKIILFSKSHSILAFNNNTKEPEPGGFVCFCRSRINPLLMNTRLATGSGVLFGCFPNLSQSSAYEILARPYPTPPPQPGHPFSLPLTSPDFRQTDRDRERGRADQKCHCLSRWLCPPAPMSWKQHTRLRLSAYLIELEC